MPSTILAVQKISSESYAAFESRGFNTLMPARLSEVPVSAFPNVENILSLNLRYIPDYVKASASGKIGLVGQFYNVLRQTQPIENFAPPVCVLRVLSKEDEALKSGMEE